MIALDGFKSDAMSDTRLVMLARYQSIHMHVPDYPLDAGTLEEDRLPVRCNGHCQPVAVPHGYGMHPMDILAFAIRRGTAAGIMTVVGQ